MNITSLTLKDCRQVAQLHQATFYRGWNEKDFESFLKELCVFGFKIEQKGGFCGYILWREVAGEAEILTLGISPSFKRMGMGNRLLNALVESLKAHSISKLFLEVAEDNQEAQDFYIKNGFISLGKRPNYYLRPENKLVHALSFLKIIEG